MVNRLAYTLIVAFFALITVTIAVAGLGAPSSVHPFAAYADIMPGKPVNNLYAIRGKFDRLDFYFDKPITYITIEPYHLSGIVRIYASIGHNEIEAITFRVAPGIVLSDLNHWHGHAFVVKGGYTNIYTWRNVRATGGGKRVGYDGFAARNAFVPMEYITFLRSGDE